MKIVRLISVLVVVWAATGDTVAQAQARFSPRSANVLGTSRAGTALPFTRVWTQMPGELAMSRMREEYTNLSPNWFMMGVKLLTDAFPVVAYMNIAYGENIIRVTCRMDRAASNLLAGHFRVIMAATEGTIGSVPEGTVVGLSDGYLLFQGGMTVMMADVTWQPGVFPDVLPTSLTITDQLVPGLWMTDQPGRVYAKHTFTSIQPPNGGQAIVHSDLEGIPVQ